MTYAEFFSRFKSEFSDIDVSWIHEHLAYQFNIEDKDAGGIFYVEVKEGRLYIEPYEYYDRHACFIAEPDTLMRIAQGEADPVEEFTHHRLRVEGNLDMALKLKDILARTQR